MLVLKRRMVSLILGLLNILLLGIVLFERRGIADIEEHHQNIKIHSDVIQSQLHELTMRHGDALRENKALVAQAEEDKEKRKDFCRVCADEKMCAEIG
jgi:hypothetical protein